MQFEHDFHFIKCSISGQDDYNKVKPKNDDNLVNLQVNNNNSGNWKFLRIYECS